MPHDIAFDHEHEKLSEAERSAIAQMIWEQDTIALRTVGIDIGSSTSHLLFARVTLKRLSEGLSSRFVVIDRQIIWRSPIMLTPFLADGAIDARELEEFFHDAYHDAGLRRTDIDSGAVILTGEAMKRKNAQVIDEIFAKESGKFVCATAGHKLECILSAHGSGATALSRRRNEPALHVDIGGGTTKLALIDRGEIVSVAAFASGGHLLAQNEQGAWTRIDDPAHLVARHLGIETSPERLSDEFARKAIAEQLATIVVDQIIGHRPPDGLGRALELTDPLVRRIEPRFITFSGGVAEYIFERESCSHGDIAKLLASEIVKQIKSRISIPIIEPMERIRATVIGASQFTVQVSGKTIYLPDKEVLPVRNVPVIFLGVDLPDRIDVDNVVAAFQNKADILELSPSAQLALAFTWQGAPEYSRLISMAKAIMQFAAPTGKRDEALFLMIDGDVGASLGRILRDELHFDGRIVSIDGIKLRDLDFVDIGELLEPSSVVPVVIKSLLFPGGAPCP